MKLDKNTPQTILMFLQKNGIGDKNTHRQWFKNGDVLVNNKSVTMETPIEADSVLVIRGKTYQIKQSNEPGRYSLYSINTDNRSPIKGNIRVQCGYHKCLTVYFKRVSRKTAFCANPLNGSFRHFFHRLDEFYQDCQQHTLNSVSGHYLDLDRFSNIKAVHIIRDPRDLLISGYFYHKRAAEDWCEYVNPTDEDWKIVNGVVPETLPAGMSFTRYLNQVSVEEGLAAEIEFRKNHFESMLRWPQEDKRVLTIRYEDVLGNETSVFQRIYDFYGFSMPVRISAVLFANRYSAASKYRKSSHIRNSSDGQWKDYFTPELSKRFNDSYADLLEKYRY